MKDDLKPVLVTGTGLPLGVYRAEEDEIQEHQPNSRTKHRSRELNPRFNPDRPECPRAPCLGREDGCRNIYTVTVWRLVPA